MSVTVGSGDWSNAGIWLEGRVPGQNDLVTLASGHSVRLDRNAAVGSNLALAALTVESGASLTTDPGTNWAIILMGHFLCEGDLLPSGTLTIIDGSWTVTMVITAGYKMRVELRNTSGVLKYVFGRQQGNPHGTLDGFPQWTYSRIGGCDTASILVRTGASFTDKPQDIYGYDVKVIMEPSTGPAVWWRGYLVSPGKKKATDGALLRLEAFGWARRLQRISVVSLGFPLADGGVVFENQDAATIAKQLLDRAKPWTGITYDGTSVTDPIGFTVPRISFNTSVFNAIKLLAEMAGMAEWCVDRDKKFWFKAKSVATRHVFVPGKKMPHFDYGVDGQGLLNRIHLMVGDEGITLENSADLVAEQSQTTNTHTTAFGKSTTYQILKQRFTPAYATLSAVEVAVAKTGFASNLLSDGDMQAGDVTAWDQLVTTYTKTPAKDAANPHGGSQCLRINQKTGANRYGIYQDATVTAEQEYRLEVWVRTQLEEVIVELVDGSGGSWANAVIDSRKTLDVGWASIAFSGKTSTGVTTMGVRVYAYNKTAGDHPFWIDDASLVLGGADVEIAIVRDNGSGTWETVVSNIIAFSEIPNTTPAAVSKSLIVPYLDLDSLATRPYAVQLQTRGSLSDSAYFLMGRDNASGAGYSGGELKYWDGAAWQTETAGDAYFKTKLPQSQKDYGVHSEVLSVGGLDDPESAQMWADAVIAARQAPLLRGAAVVESWAEMLEANLPLDLTRIQGEMTDGALIERIAYTSSEKTLRVQVEFGGILPKIADLIANLEYRISQR